MKCLVTIGLLLFVEAVAQDYRVTGVQQVHHVTAEVATQTATGYTLANQALSEPRCYMNGLRWSAVYNDYTWAGNTLAAPYWIAKGVTDKLICDYEY